MRTLKQTFNLQRLKSQIGMFYLLGFVKFANSKLLIHLPNLSLVYGAKTKNQSLQLLQSNPLVFPHDESFLCFHLPVKESPHSLSDHCSYIPSRIHVLLYQGEVNVATAHLWHGKTNSYNIPYISSMLPGTDVIVLHLLKRKQGFYVKKGNPKRIQSFEDLKRADVTIVNREPGSGVRVLVDEKLRQAGISTQEVNGYQKVVNSHLEAAATVNRGEADVAVGSEKHSLSVPGIDFIFIQEESYDMVIRKEDFTKKPYQKMIEIIRSPEYQKEVAGLGSYNVENMGKIIYSDCGCRP